MDLRSCVADWPPPEQVNTIAGPSLLLKCFSRKEDSYESPRNNTIPQQFGLFCPLRKGNTFATMCGQISFLTASEETAVSLTPLEKIVFLESLSLFFFSFSIISYGMV